MAQALQDLISRLERSHSAFCEGLVALGETDRLDVRLPSTGGTARELSALQIRTERIFRTFFMQLLHGADPVLDDQYLHMDAGGDAETSGTPLTRLVRLVESEREQTLTLLAHCTDSDLRRSGRTSTGGSETLEGAIIALAQHEGHHATQMLHLAQAAAGG